MTDNDAGGSMKPVIVENRQAEIKSIPVSEVTTNRKSNYADQEGPQKTENPG